MIILKKRWAGNYEDKINGETVGTIYSSGLKQFKDEIEAIGEKWVAEDSEENVMSQGCLGIISNVKSEENQFKSTVGVK